MLKIGLLTTAHIHTPDFIKRIRERGDLAVAGVFDPTPALAQRYADQLGAPALASPAPLLEDAGVSALLILGTTRQHDDWVVPAARAGKHLFVEKPLAVSSVQAQRMVQAITAAGVTYQTGHFMRSEPRFRFIQQEIAAGHLGTITRVRVSNSHHGSLGGWFDADFHWFTEPFEAGGGGFYDLGCHALDLLVWFFGPVATATGCIGGKAIRYPAIDEYGEGLLRFANGVTASLAAGWVDRANPNELEISGSEGHLHLHWGTLHYISHLSKIPGTDGSTHIDPRYFPPPVPGALDLFFDVLLGKADPALLVPAADSLQVVKTMESIYVGDRLGSWVKVS